MDAIGVVSSRDGRGGAPQRAEELAQIAGEQDPAGRQGRRGSWPARRFGMV
jgi:hypothetical protein